MPDIIRFGADASDFLKDAQQVVRQLDKMGFGLQEVTKITTKYNRSGDQFSETVKSIAGVTSDYNRILVTVKDNQEDFTVSVRESTSEQKRQRKEIEKQIAAEKRLNAQRAQRTRRTREFLEKRAPVPQNTRATQQELVNFRNAESQLLQFVKANNIAASDVRNIWNQVSKNSIQLFPSKRFQDLQQRIINVQKNYGQLGNTAEIAAKRSRESLERFNKAQERAREHADGLLISWQSFFRLAIIQTLHIGISTLANALQQAASDAAELSIRLAEIQTIDESNTSLATFNKELRAISDNLGLDIIDLAESEYETLSNQIAEGAESFKFLNEAARLAIVGVTSNENAVNLLSSAINAFGFEISEVNEISAKFFKTVDLGRLRVEDIADKLGRVAVPANHLGVSFEELNAALATATIRGVKADEAMTLIRNVFLKLLRPTGAMKELFAELGVESGQAAIQTFGFADFMAILEERTRGSANELGELFGRIRAITGAMIFAGQGVEDFADALEQIEGAAEGFGKKTDLILESSGKIVQIFGNQVRNTFVQDVGGAFIDASANVITFGKDVKAAFDSIAKTELQLNIEQAINDQETLEEQFKDITDNIVDAYLKMSKESNREVSKMIAEQIAEINKFETEASKSLEEITKETEKFTEAFSKEFEKGVKDAEAFNDRIFDLGKKVFEFDLEGEDIGGQIDLLNSKIAQLQSAAVVSARIGDRDLLEKQLDSILELETKVLELQQDADKENTETAEKREDSQEKRKELQEELTKDIEKQNKKLKEADGDRDKEAQIREKIKEINSEFKDDLKEIKEEESELKDIVIDRVDARQRFSKFLQFELAAMQELNRQERRRSAELKEQTTILNERLNITRFEELAKEVTGFSFKDIFDEDDLEERIPIIDQQTSRLKELIALRKQANIQDEQSLVLDRQLSYLEQLRINTQGKFILQIRQRQKVEEQARTETRLRAQQEQYAEVNKRVTELGQSLEYVSALVPELRGVTLENILTLGNPEAALERIRKKLEELQKENSKVQPVTGFGVASDRGIGGEPSERFDPIANALEQIKEFNKKGSLGESVSILESYEKIFDDLNQELDEAGIEVSLGKAKGEVEEIIPPTQVFADILTLGADQAKRTADELSRARATMSVFQGQRTSLPRRLLNQAYGTSSLRTHTDSIPAMLTPGEFVMNAKSTKRFYSQLVAMNSGQGYNQGGPVTTNNFGGININSSGNAQQDVIQLAKAIKREIRRGTVKL